MTFGPLVHADASVCFILLGTANVTAVPQITNVGIDTCYSCKSEETLVTRSVNQTLWNVLIQAFVSNGTLSENGEHLRNHPPFWFSCFSRLHSSVLLHSHHLCRRPDHNHGGPHHSFHNSSHHYPHPHPHAHPPRPHHRKLQLECRQERHSLSARQLWPEDRRQAGKRTSATHTVLRWSTTVTPGCLILFCPSLEQKYEEMNLDPNGTIVSGSCGVNSSQLVLMSDAVNITLTFTNVSHLLSRHFY